MTRNPPSHLEAHLGYWLRMVSNAVSNSFARAVAGEGVTVAEWVFLRVLYDAAPISPSRLAGEMGVTKGAVSKLAERLVEKALVERTASRGAGRTQTLTLTRAGRALVPRLARLADGNDTAFFGNLPLEERAELGRLLKTIADHHGLVTAPTT